MKNENLGLGIYYRSVFKTSMFFVILFCFFYFWQAAPLESAEVAIYGGTYSSWPLTWHPLHSLNDSSDASLNGTPYLDVIGDSSYPAFYHGISQDGNYYCFRVRVRYNGAVDSKTYSPFNTSGTVLILIKGSSDNPPDDNNPVYGFAFDFLANHGLEMMVRGATGDHWHDINMEDIDGNSGAKLAPDFDAAAGRSGDGYIRTVDGQDSGSPWGATTFIDFAISCSYLTYLVNYPSTDYTLACGQSWQLQVATIVGGNDHQPINGDVAGGKTKDSLVSGSWLIGTRVNLTNFGVRDIRGKALITWETHSEVDNAGFHIWRAMGPKSEFLRLTSDLIPAQGFAYRGALYAYEDAAVLPGFTYFYKLEDVDMNGTSTFHGPVVFILGTITPQFPADGMLVWGRIPVRFNWHGGPFSNFRLEFSSSPDFTTSIVSLPPSTAGSVPGIAESYYFPKTKEWEQISALNGHAGVLYWRVRGFTPEGAQAVSETRKLKISPGGLY